MRRLQLTAMALAAAMVLMACGGAATTPTDGTTVPAPTETIALPSATTAPVADAAAQPAPVAAAMPVFIDFYAPW